MILVIGYVASIFLAFSLIVKNAIKFRILNILGCITFIIYGVLIPAFPVILANGLLLCINIYQLFKLHKSVEQFKYVSIEPTDKIVEHFIEFYKNDIEQYFPSFKAIENNSNQISFVVLRDAAIASIFAANVDAEGNATIKIDYTIPQYRDYKVGKFIFEKEKTYLINNQVKKVVYETVSNKKHLNFIQVMGFSQEFLNGSKCWTKSLV
jgi:hypothetical protein